MATLERAIQIAAEAHMGQRDKGNSPYILHPLRLMFRVETTVCRVVAVLHDVIEDSGWTLDGLRGEGFSEQVLEALDCLTKRDGEPYADFIERVRPNPLARLVKIADLEDNMDLSRIPELRVQDRRRITRYQAALAALRGSDDAVA
jgi:(p)ppGpp synthase/HD superfamily hydrolase